MTEVTAPFAQEMVRLDTIPGVNQRTAEVLGAEIGVDRQRVPTAAPLSRGARLCPGHNNSAGQHRSGKTRKGTPWLRIALTEAVQAAIRRTERALWAHATIGSCAIEAIRRRSSPSRPPSSDSRILS